MGKSETGQVDITEEEKYRLKKLVEELKEKRGRGTELISLYIPPERRISDVVNYLREEYGTAANIKSDVTKKNVQDAISKTIERLKFYDKAPENGLAIFCGAIPQNGPGSEQIELYAVEPPKPVNLSLYRCDSRFHVEHIEELLKEGDVFGLVAIDVNDAAIAVLEGSYLQVLSTHTSGIPGKHRAGGQSARRFERLREMQKNEFFKRISDYVNKAFLDEEYEDRMTGVLIGGPGHTKHDFVDAGDLDYRIEDKILSYIDLNYAGEEGVREMMTKAEDVLREARYVEEKKLVEEFIGEVSKKGGLAVKGLEDTVRAIKMGAADTVIVIDDFQATNLRKQCANCSFEKEVMVREADEESIDNTCPSCGKDALEIEREGIHRYLRRMKDVMGMEVETISWDSEHGEMFEEIGGGIGAMLRYPISTT